MPYDIRDLVQQWIRWWHQDISNDYLNQCCHISGVEWKWNVQDINSYKCLKNILLKLLIHLPGAIELTHGIVFQLPIQDVVQHYQQTLNAESATNAMELAQTEEMGTSIPPVLNEAVVVSSSGEASKIKRTLINQSG